MLIQDIKYRLAKIITSLYHSQEEVDKAIHYDAVFSKAVPDDIPTIIADPNRILLMIIPRLIAMGMIKAEASLSFGKTKRCADKR